MGKFFFLSLNNQVICVKVTNARTSKYDVFRSSSILVQTAPFNGYIMSLLVLGSSLCKINFRLGDSRSVVNYFSNGNQWKLVKYSLIYGYLNRFTKNNMNFLIKFTLNKMPAASYSTSLWRSNGKDNCELQKRVCELVAATVVSLSFALPMNDFWFIMKLVIGIPICGIWNLWDVLEKYDRFTKHWKN